MSEQRFSLPDRLAALLLEHTDRQAIADASRLLVKVGLQPLLDAWKRAYVKVSPDLSQHLQAHAEFCVIMDLERVLSDFARHAPEAGEGTSLFERALGQAEEEMGAMGGEESEGLVE